MRPELSVVAFICTALALIPLPLHWRARNIPTLSLIFWLTAVNFPRGINAIIWAGNTNNSAPVWCDITTRLYMGANWGYCSSAAAMCRYMAHVSSPYHQVESASKRRRRMIFEIVMCAVLPLIGIALYYVVQDRRFIIYEDFGCSQSFTMNIASLFIVNLTPVVFALITMVYAGISLRWFVQRRTQFEAVLQSNNSGLTTSRYLRLISLSITMMLATTGMTAFVFFDNASNGGILPWVSWEYVHANWHQVDQITKDLAPQPVWERYLLTWYMVPVTSIIFFAFFGFGKEARVEYIRYFNFVKTKVFGVKPMLQPVLPVSVHDGMNTTDSTIIRPAVVKSHAETTMFQTLEKLEASPGPIASSENEDKAKDPLDFETRP